MNAILKENGEIAFEFNSYILSVFVIFFLQVNSNLPTVDKFISSDQPVETNDQLSDESKNFGLLVRAFFQFYGDKYNIEEHLISTYIGQWQQIRLQNEQKRITPAQKRYY